MNVPAGYKQTEVGVIPEDWDVCNISDIAKVYDGTHQTPKYVHFGVPFYSVENVTKNDFRNTKYISEVEHKFLTRNFKIQKNDVLMTRIGSIGDCKLVDWDVDASFYVSLALLKFHGANAKYIEQYSKSIKFKREVELHSLISAIPKKINLGPISDIRIIIPDWPEQQAIAIVLSDTDALIESLAQLIAKKRQIKQGAMQELLTGQRRLPGFSGEWGVKRLGALLTIRHGKSQKGVESIDGAYPILATGGQIGRANQFLSDRPSVLIGRKGTIDKPQYMDTPFWTVDTLFYSDIHPKNSAKFLFYWFCSIDWKQYNEASGVPSLNARTIESVEILCPEPVEQTAIATVLSNMDTELAALESRLTKARHIKQGMIQELLTGRIRLL